MVTLADSGAAPFDGKLTTAGNAAILAPGPVADRSRLPTAPLSEEEFDKHLNDLIQLAEPADRAPEPR